MPSVDLTQFPRQLAEALGITTFAGQMIASAIVIALFVFPTIFLSKKFKLTDATPVLMMIVSMGIVVALAWFPVWLFTIAILTIVILYARLFMHLGGD